jgi:hypothetical protein
VRQRILETRRRVVEERLRERDQRQAENGGRWRIGDRGDAGERPQREDCRDRERRVVRLAGRDVSEGNQHHPERMGVRLHPLRGIPSQTVAIQEVVNRPERDVGVVGNPRGADEENEVEAEEEDERDDQTCDRAA